jgi:hypothetical protein
VDAAGVLELLSEEVLALLVLAPLESPLFDSGDFGFALP